MRSSVRFLRTVVQFLAFAITGALLVTLRFFLKTPQPLESILPGEGHLYKWTQGHVFYKVLGEAASPPLVLVHAPGVGASSFEMRAIMGELARYYRVYALDLLGFGLSDRPHVAYTADIYVRLLKDFLTHVVGQPATILASGLSCNYSIAVALDSPSLCERLIVISPVSLFARRSVRTWLSGVMHTSLLSVMLYALLMPRPVLRRVIAWQQQQDYRNITDEQLDYAFASSHQFGAQHAVLAFLLGELDLAIAARLEAIQQPTMIVWSLQALQAAGPNVREHALPERAQVVLLREARVRVQEEAPEKVVANILAWRDEGSVLAAVSPGQMASSTETAASTREAAVLQKPAAPAEPQAPDIEERAPEAEKPPVTENRQDAESRDRVYPSADKSAEEVYPSADYEISQPKAESEPACHPERSEGSDLPGTEILSAAKDDRADPGGESSLSAGGSGNTSEASMVTENISEGETVTSSMATENISKSEAEVVADDLPVAEPIEAYCVKCRQKRVIQNPARVLTKKGRRAVEGVCPVCGTRLFRFVAH